MNSFIIYMKKRQFLTEFCDWCDEKCAKIFIYSDPYVQEHSEFVKHQGENSLYKSFITGSYCKRKSKATSEMESTSATIVVKRESGLPSIKDENAVDFILNMNSDSESNSSNNHDENAVDFLLNEFPLKTLETDSSSPQDLEGNGGDLSEIDEETNHQSNLAEDTDEYTHIDSELGSTYDYVEINGNRWYDLRGSMVCLKPDEIEKLKTMEKIKRLDSQFVSVLLDAIFGDDILKESSAFGGKSNYNKTSHKALDGKKLKFIRDLFEERVGTNTARKKVFVKFVNKKCNNLRRN